MFKKQLDLSPGRILGIPRYYVYGPIKVLTAP